MDTIQILWFELTTTQLTTFLRCVEIAGIVIPMIGIVVILQKEQSKSATYLMLANAACAIMNCAYLMILETDSYSSLVTAYRMEYLATSLFFFFFVLFIMEYQHMRLTRFISVVWPLFELIEIPQMWLRSAISLNTGEDAASLSEAASEVAEAATEAAASLEGEAAENASKIADAASKVADAAGSAASDSTTQAASDAANQAGHTFGDLGNRWMGDVHISLDDRLGMYTINMDGGILYYVRYGLFSTGLLFLFMYTLIRYLHTPNKTERHNLWHLMAAQVFFIGAMMVSWFVDIPFDIMPLASSIVVCAMTLSVLVGEFFTVTDRGKDWVLEHIDDMVLIVDDAYGYLDANRYAKRVFPQLNFYHKNQRLSDDIMALFSSENDEIEIEDHFYDRRSCTLYQNEKRKKKIAGYGLILTDVTKQQQLVQEAEAANEAKSAFLSNMSHEIRTPMNAIVGMTEIMLRSDVTDEQREYLSNIKTSGDSLLNIINDILDFSKIESGKMELVEADYAPMSMISDLGIMFLTRIGEKPVELLYDIDPALPAKLYGDGLRVRQIIINILNNAVKFTEEGYVKLSIRLAERKGDDVVLDVRVKDTGAGIRPEDQDKLFQSFSQVDSHKNHSKEGTGLGLSICRQLVTMMGGEIGVHSSYGNGSEFYFTIHQKIADANPAADLSESERQLVIGGAFIDTSMQENFECLAKAYDLTPILIHELPEPEPHVDFFFTDAATYEKYRAQIDASMLTKDQVCILQNPITESVCDPQARVMNKPLYTLNFCQALRREKLTENVAASEVLNFMAPEAKILLVDDNAMNLKVASGLLAPLQMQIDTAENGKQAVEMVEKKDYDIVLMDHMMPIMDGIEATKHIRAMSDERKRDVVIIALTADAMAGAKDTFVAAGMNDFVAKPIELKDICAKLRMYLPEEKVVKTKEIVVSDTAKSEELPEIEGLNVEEGIRYSGGSKLFFSLLGDYYKLIDTKTKKIEQCLADGLIRDLTIEVHALKNTSRMIGASELSADFYELEQLGNAEDAKALEEKVPKVLELYQSYKPILKPYGHVDDANLLETDVKTLRGILQTMADAMDGFDLDGVDASMGELEKYRLPESVAEDMEALQAAVADVAMEDVIAICQQMQEKLEV